MAAWVLCFVRADAARAAEMPRGAVSPRTHEFGSLFNPTHVTGHFVVTNSGNVPLTIQRLVPDCDSCTVATVSAERLPPGGSADLVFQLDLREFSGPVRRGLTLVTDDPEHPHLRVEMQGEARPAFRLTPRNVLLVTRPTPGAATVEIQAISRLSAPLSRVKADSPHVDACLAGSGANRTTLLLRPGPQPPSGLTRFSVEVSSSNPEDPVCRVVGMISVPEDLEVYPSRLVFPATPGPDVRLVQVRQYVNPGLRLLNVTSSVPELRCEILAERNGTDYRLHVSRWPTTAPTSSRATLSLLLADGAGRTRRKDIPVLLGENETSPRSGPNDSRPHE